MPVSSPLPARSSRARRPPAGSRAQLQHNAARGAANRCMVFGGDKAEDASFQVSSLSASESGVIESAELELRSDGEATPDAPRKPIDREGASPGLKSTPLGAGVHNATARFDLPSPTLAVRNLIESTQFAHLCTNMSNMHHRRAGYPFGMLVDFACDGAGYPIFCLSPLSIHSHNLREDPRCSLVVQMPGWSGLSNARVTIFGDVYELPDQMQEAAKEIFLLKHHNGEGQSRVIAESFRFYRMMKVRDIYFVGGFGTMQWIDVKDYTSTKPDDIVMYHPHDTIDMLNDVLSSGLDGLHGGSGQIISIDARGMDVRVRHEWESTMHRVSFGTRIRTPEELRRAAQAALGV